MSKFPYSRLARVPRGSFFLLGVRGVGKSTWAHRHLAHARLIDLLDEARYEDYLTDPSLFGAELRSVPSGGWVVVDEIQRLPNLLNEVHRFIEQRGRARYHTGLLRGLRAMAELNGLARRILVYGGRRSFRTEDGIDVWTFDRLRQALADDALWP